MQISEGMTKEHPPHKRKGPKGSVSKEEETELTLENTQKTRKGSLKKQVISFFPFLSFVLFVPLW